MLNKVASTEALQKVEQLFRDQIQPLFGEQVGPSVKFHLVGGIVELKQAAKRGNLEKARVKYRELSDFIKTIKGGKST